MITYNLWSLVAITLVKFTTVWDSLCLSYFHIDGLAILASWLAWSSQYKNLLAVQKNFEVPVVTCSDKENSLLKQKFVVQAVLLIIRVIVTSQYLSF